MQYIPRNMHVACALYSSVAVRYWLIDSTHIYQGYLHRCQWWMRQPWKNDDVTTLRWRHNERDSVSNHQPHDCLFNRLFRRRSKKTSKLRVTGLCAGNSPGTGEFPAQMASYAENVSIWWRHHEMNTFSALLALVSGHHWIPWQRPVTRSFYIFFDMRLNKRWSKQSRRLWFETPLRALCRQCNVLEVCANQSHKAQNIVCIVCGTVSILCQSCGECLDDRCSIGWELRLTLGTY